MDDVIIPDINWSQTSDSDFSDSEMSRHTYAKKTERKIRLLALSVLLHVVKVSLFHMNIHVKMPYL